MFEELSARKVESELVELAGQLAAATCRFLQLLAEFDAREGWAGAGVRSCTHWLNWRVGLSLRTAREHLRVAHALVGLPAITEAFAGGRVSYSKVRAMTRIATPQTERGLLNIALHGTASHVETVVAGAQAAMRRRTAASERSMRWRRDSDGSLLVSLRLPAAEGAQLVAAVEAMLADDDGPPEHEGGPAGPDEGTAAVLGGGGSAEPLVGKAAIVGRGGPADVAAVVGQNGPAEPSLPIASRRADALLALVAGRQQANPPTVVIHLRADAATSEPDERPAAWIEGGPAIPTAVAERLACGAALQALVVDRRGNPLHLGRRRRTVSPAQLCALRVRDRDHCVFPGCPQTRHLQAHHVRWWRHGGPTDLDNLALVCIFHHRLVHDHGFHLRSDGMGGFAADRPDGASIPAAGTPTHGRTEAIRAPGIDDGTITPRWGGERLDLRSVLEWLRPAA
jgi:hypothetical protein